MLSKSLSHLSCTKKTMLLDHYKNNLDLRLRESLRDMKVPIGGMWRTEADTTAASKEYREIPAIGSIQFLIERGD